MIVWTSVAVSGFSSIVMMNERSIFSVSTGNLARYESEEVAGAEVVDRDADSELAHVLELLDVALDVSMIRLSVISRSMPAGATPSMIACSTDADEIALAQLDSRYVHGDFRRLEVRVDPAR